MFIPPTGGPPNISSYYQPTGDIKDVWKLIIMAEKEANPSTFLSDVRDLMKKLSELDPSTKVAEKHEDPPHMSTMYTAAGLIAALEKLSDPPKGAQGRIQDFLKELTLPSP